jgi:hypothetical protein
MNNEYKRDETNNRIILYLPAYGTLDCKGRLFIPPYISSDDLEIVRSFGGTWCAKYDRPGSLPYVKGRLGKSQIRLHQWLWQHKHGNIPQGKEIDHRNQIRNDNRSENLRLLDRQGQNANRRRQTDDPHFDPNGLKHCGEHISGKYHIQSYVFSIYLGRYKPGESYIANLENNIAELLLSKRMSKEDICIYLGWINSRAEFELAFKNVLKKLNWKPSFI